MKYFTIRAEKLPHPLPSMKSGMMYEVSKEKALDMYKLVDDYDGTPEQNFNNGTFVDGKYWAIWGENISNAECFQRRLSGTLATKIFIYNFICK